MLMVHALSMTGPLAWIRSRAAFGPPQLLNVELLHAHTPNFRVGL